MADTNFKMQIDQREALDDPCPIVGVMAHAYAQPLLLNAAGSNNKSSSHALGDIGVVEGKTTRVDGDGGGIMAPDEEAQKAKKVTEEAGAAANELVIDALLGADSETIGPQVRFLGVPRGTNFPEKKPGGGAWRGADGLRVVDSALPRGLVKKGWLHKHTRDLPGSLVYLASVDVAASVEGWANIEDEIVADLVKVMAGLAARDIKVRHGRGGLGVPKFHPAFVNY